MLAKEEQRKTLKMKIQTQTVPRKSKTFSTRKSWQAHKFWMSSLNRRRKSRKRTARMIYWQDTPKNEKNYNPKKEK